MPTLNWIGKQAVVNHHHEVAFHLLKDVPELSCGDPGSRNLIVEGDNLIALKALLPYYAKQVKCIYIDPPYNTGNEAWIYNDNVNSPIIKRWLGKTVRKEGEDLSRHDKWLCMMYPRLMLLRELLTNDGILLMSIDDNEVANAKLILNEVLGPQNFIAQLVWEKGRKNDAKLFSVGHEYIFVYARSKQALAKTIWRAAKAGVSEIAAEYHRLRALHKDDFKAVSKGLALFYKQLPKEHPAKKYARAKNADKRGVWRDNNISWPGGGGPRYEIPHPETGQACKIPDDGWRFVEDSMKEKIADDPPWVDFRKDHTKPPFLKSYVYMVDERETDDDLFEGKKEVLGSVFYRHSQPSLDLMKDLFGSKVFPNPKDHEVLARLIRYVTSDDKNCVVLDSFAGSGTTGHAVLELNKQDQGNRRFVLVEMEPEIARSITARRIRFVVDGFTDSKGGTVSGLGGGFRFCEVGESLFNENGTIRTSVTYGNLARHVYFTETGEPLPNSRATKSPLLGITSNGVAVYLLYNGIIEDRLINGGNILTSKTLSLLPQHNGLKVVYAAGSRLSNARLKRENITFKQTPYAIKVK